MRDITPSLTPELQRYVRDPRRVSRAEAYPVDTFTDLVRHIARLAYLNKDHLLFYRGQSRDYRNRRSGGSAFYPSIYRGAYLPRDVVHQRFELLERAGRRLHALFAHNGIEGHHDLARRRTIQWAVLQHYGVCSTPLLDLTQSLRVACSFAQQPDGGSTCYVFVFGLPHITNRISVNSEHDLITIRLLSICPPAALRPYFQEGYLVGTADITTDYEPKSELNFSRRLIAKFEIPNHSSFWEPGLSRMADHELYPPGDDIEALCRLIDLTPDPSPRALALSEFVAAWTALEQQLLAAAQRRRDRVPTIREAVHVLQEHGLVEPWIATELDRLRHLRNSVVHGSLKPNEVALRDAAASARKIRESLRSVDKGGPA